MENPDSHPLSGKLSKDAFGFARKPAALIEQEQADSEPRRVLDPNDPRDRKLIEEHEAAARRIDQVRAGFEKRGKSIERVMKGFMTLVFLLPFAGTCYLGYQSLWFKFAAAEAQGQVVSVHPTVVVEYLNGAEQKVRWSAPHDEIDIAVGASVRVFYDRKDPDRVRLDVFEEMWATTLLLGGLTLFVGLLAGAVWWGTMRQPRTGSKAVRLP